jgi:hypothetical protein
VAGLAGHPARGRSQSECPRAVSESNRLQTESRRGFMGR